MVLNNWASIAFAILGLSAFGSLQDASPLVDAANETTQEEIDLGFDRDRRYTLPVRINDTGPYNFMVDTGAEATVVSRTIADTLGLGGRKSATLVGMASRRLTETVEIDALTFGSRTVPVRAAPLVDATTLGSIDGILGLDILQNQRVLIDFEDGIIAVDDADQLGGNSGYEIVVRARERLGQLIITSARINNVRTAIIVDTGAQGSIGNLALQRRLPGRTVGYQWSEDVNGVRRVNPMRIVDKLKLGNAELSNFPVAFTDAEPFRLLGLEDQPAMILGLHEMRMFRRVAIDFRTRRILFDMPRGVSLRRGFSQSASRID